MGNILESTIASEMQKLFRNSSAISSPWRYAVNMGTGIREYVGIVIQGRGALMMGELLSRYSNYVNATTDTAYLEDAIARIQGAFFMNNLINEILVLRVDENYANRKISLGDDVVNEISQAYNSLGEALVKAIMENDSDITQPGETINISAVRPKNPKDAELN